MRELRQSTYVSLAHRYWNHGWSDDENRATYGRLASPTGVGNNLRVDVSVRNERDLEPAVRTVRALLDHRAVHNDEPTFLNEASTLERLTAFVGRRLASELGTAFLRIAVFETERFSCTYEAADDARVSITQREYNLSLICRAPVNPTTGLAVPRDAIGSAVRRVAPRFAEAFDGPAGAWGESLCRALRAELPQLAELRVDLDRHCSLRVMADV